MGGGETHKRLSRHQLLVSFISCLQVLFYGNVLWHGTFQI